MQLNQIAFYILSACAIGFALLTITRKSAVVSALMLVMTFCFLAAIYLTLDAQFLAVVQVAVYAGAIMVLVLFVINRWRKRPVNPVASGAANNSGISPEMLERARLRAARETQD